MSVIFAMKRSLLLAVMLSVFGWSTVSSFANTEIYDAKTPQMGQVRPRHGAQDVRPQQAAA